MKRARIVYTVQRTEDSRYAQLYIRLWEASARDVLDDLREYGLRDDDSGEHYRKKAAAIKTANGSTVYWEGERHGQSIELHWQATIGRGYSDSGPTDYWYGGSISDGASIDNDNGDRIARKALAILKRARETGPHGGCGYVQPAAVLDALDYCRGVCVEYLSVPGEYVTRESDPIDDTALAPAEETAAA